MTLVGGMVALLTVSQFSQSVSEPQQCRVTGHVLDLLVDEAVMPGAKITFINGGSKSVTSDDGGKYEILLPSGVYKISLAKPVVSPAFDRSELILKCPDDVNLNFYPFPENTNWKSGGIIVKFDTLPRAPDTVSTATSNFVASNARIFVSYSSKKIVNGSYVYDFALLTYNHSTLYADQVIVNRKNQIFIDGAVWLEDGKSRKKFPKGTKGFLEHTEAGIGVKMVTRSGR